MGRCLAAYFSPHYHIVVLSRQPAKKEEGVTFVKWDARTRGEWETCLQGASVLLNLTGRSVNCRYHAANRAEILQSRVESTHVLGLALANTAAPPALWINLSTATIYKHTFGEAHDETGECGGTPQVKDVFSVEVAEAWEKAFFEAETPKTRKVALRTAMVLGQEKGGVMEVLTRLTKLGLGGKMGSGRQYFSWIHERDFSRLVEWLIAHPEITGVLNAAAPEPLPNQAFMQALRHALGVPFGVPATTWMLELGAFFLQTETELILKSRRVVSKRLPENGFSFQFPSVKAAFENLCKS